MNHAKSASFATFLLIAASFPAIAQEAPAAADAEAAPVIKAAAAPTAELSPKKKSPWAGSAITYGHSAAARSIRKDAEGHYNPVWGHRLDLRPQWNLGEHLFVRSRIELAQEFTSSDVYSYRNEVVFGDPYFEIGSPGWQDPFAGLRIGGSLRMTAGLSKASQSETEIVGIAPGVSLSRSFPLLSGLTLRYDARYAEHFHRYTTRQNSGSTLPDCFDPNDIQCSALKSNGALNTRRDITHGPAATFSPIAPLTISTQFVMFRGWRYDKTPSEFDDVAYNPVPDPGMDDLWGFTAAVDYQVLPELNLTLASSTFAHQLDPESRRRSPFSNRHTNFSLDVSLNVEKLISRF